MAEYDALPEPPKMQRRHFEWLAAVLREGDFRDTHGAAHTFADALTEANSNFDRARFLRACGVED